MSIGLIVPAYGHYDYVHKTVNSFFEYSPDDSLCYVIDDCSPDWHTFDDYEWPNHVFTRDNDINVDSRDPYTRLTVHKYNVHKDLTRSWNKGLQLACSDNWGVDYVICGNSDILFTDGWYEPLITALDRYALVGPLTNAPGRVLNQNINRYLRDYKLTDDQLALNQTAAKLRNRHKGKCKDNDRINGFFMMGKTVTWWKYGYNSEYVFNPASPMANVAYEIQTRLRTNKQKLAIVLDSYIFHYRSITRGDVGIRGIYGRGAYRGK